jgi:hypothetical protein
MVQGEKHLGDQDGCLGVSDQSTHSKTIGRVILTRTTCRQDVELEGDTNSVGCLYEGKHPLTVEK